MKAGSKTKWSDRITSRECQRAQNAQERGGASPPVLCVKVVRYEPAGLRPAAPAYIYKNPESRKCRRYAAETCGSNVLTSIGSKCKHQGYNCNGQSK